MDSTGHDSAEDVQQRARLTFELFRASLEIMRQNLRRRDPSASDREIEERLQAWLFTRPGAELGDADGVPGNRFDDLRARWTSSPQR